MTNGQKDHFLELDLYDQAWEVLCDIIDDEQCQDILLDIGMPVSTFTKSKYSSLTSLSRLGRSQISILQLSSNMPGPKDSLDTTQGEIRRLKLCCI